MVVTRRGGRGPGFDVADRQSRPKGRRGRIRNGENESRARIAADNDEQRRTYWIIGVLGWTLSGVTFVKHLAVVGRPAVAPLRPLSHRRRPVRIVVGGVGTIKFCAHIGAADGRCWRQ